MMTEKLKALCVMLLGLLLVACSSDDSSVAWRTYPDAVVNINQVDPAYRAYFRSQHGANYSLRDQREAFIAATRTARTPVPKYVPQQAAAPKKKSQARRGKATARGKGKGKARGKTKATPKKKGNVAKSKRKSSRKSTRRRR
ncbi:MAG: hypothetical protein IJO34_02095 [Akkermansia sp.]|nr:hypothetical protein [Akkermansia sp.]